MDDEKIDEYVIPEKSEDKIRVSISGENEDFKTFKKTKKYKELIDKGVKVVFKSKKSAQILKNENLKKIVNETKNLNNFNEIFSNIIFSEKNPYLLEIYESIINNNTIKGEDIMII
jgi:hypothetical protein